MKNFIILLYIVTSTTLCAQNHFHRNVPNKMADSTTAEMVKKADKIAYERACNDSIYKKEVMQSFLDYYDIEVEDINRNTKPAFYYIINSNTFRRNQPSMLPALYSIMNRVVTKGKKIKSEDKVSWKQIYYDFEYDRIFTSIFREQQAAEARKDSIEDYQKRHDWSKSEILKKLREYCSQDFSVADSFVIKFIEKYNITFTEQMRLGYLRPWHDDLNESTKNMFKLRDFLDNEFKYNPISQKYEKSYDTEDVYSMILHECRYMPELKGSISSSHSGRDRYSEKLHELYERDKNDENVRELDSLFKRWKYITDEMLMEKQYLSKSKFKQRCIELEEVISDAATHTLKDGVLKKDGCIIPYRVDGDKFVVHGTCIINNIEEQYPNATGAQYKSYTCNLKLVVKVENGKAISQNLSGRETMWDQNEKLTGRTYYERRKKILAAKPIVAMTHQVNYSYRKYGETPLYLQGTWDEMLNKLRYVLWHASLDYDDFSISKLCTKYLESPSENGLKRIRMPFVKVDMSAINEK